MHYFPSSRILVQDDCPPIQHSGVVVQMKRCNRHISEHLDGQISGLNVHVRRLRTVAANLLEDFLELCLDLLATGCSTGNIARIKDARIIGKETAELTPIQIVEGLNEL